MVTAIGVSNDGTENASKVDSRHTLMIPLTHTTSVSNRLARPG